MIDRVIVHPGSYHDSAFLMRLARELKALPGVDEAVVLMGTAMNRELLENVGFRDAVLQQITPMDLVVAIRADESAQIDAATDELQRLMRSASSGTQADVGERSYASIGHAVHEHPEANLVTVAVPGQYAGWVAGRALDAGRHVFLFSDNVPLDEELALKRRARELGLLMMGPDCGTAILAGTGLGFANRVRRGRVGLVGASGTGIQEVTCLVHQGGEGVSQAIGTGSHDLSAKIDGVMSEFGLELLAADTATEVVVLVAKKPATAVAERLHGVMAGLGKPVIVRYLGREEGETRDGVIYAASLDQAADAALAALPGSGAAEGDGAGADQSAGAAFDAAPQVQALLGDRRRVEGRLIGLFGGGSLTTEAALILRRAGLEVTVPEKALTSEGPVEGRRHLVVDTGDDEYTRGKPHPMVDQTVRCELIRKAGSDPAVGLLLLDLVLGDGAHLDPAPELVQAVEQARASRTGQPLLVIASVTGTDLDPQDPQRQRRVLEAGGIHVQPSGARAARVAAGVLSGKGEQA